jgi:hypothetical protein
MPIPLLAIGMGLSAGSSIMGGLAKSSAMQKQAVQNRIAAVWSRIKAEDDADTIREQGRRFQSNQAAGFAKSGVLIDSGSPLATLMDTSIRIERNALKTVLHGDQEAGNYEATASSLMSGAKSAVTTGILSGVGQGISAYAGTQKGYTPSVAEEP